MILFNAQSRLFRSLNKAVLFSLIFQIISPTVQAMGVIGKSEKRHISSTGLARWAMPSMKSTRIEPSKNTLESVSEIVNNSSSPLMVAGGPGQTESSSFSLNTTDGMVNQFTGDFSYSLPLMDVEGYPIALSYNSNVGMTDEASWVGLGWNLNVGSIAREMRGIPDEFNGSQNIERKYSVLEDDITNGYKFGVTAGVMKKGTILTHNSKFKTDISILFGGYDNTYTGHSRTFDFNVGASLAVGKPGAVEKVDKFFGGRGGLGYSSDSKNGIGRSTSVGFIGSFGESKGSTVSGQYGLNWGSNYHSRAGVTQRSIGANFAFGINGYNAPFSLGSTFTCGGITAVPRYEVNSTAKSSQWVFDATLGYKKKASKWGFVIGLETETFHTDQSFKFSDPDYKLILNPAFGYFHSQKRSNYSGSNKPIMDFNRERDGQFSEEMKHLAYSFPTYDVFYVNGMGMSATFRGMRNDIGVYRDPSGFSETSGSAKEVSAGINIASGNPSATPVVPTDIDLTVGFVYHDNDGDSKSGKWQNGTEFFQFGDDNTIQYKGIGEPTPKNNALFNEVGGNEASYLKLQKVEGGTTAINKTDQLVTLDVQSTLNSGNITAANQAEIRSNIYKPLLASDATYNMANHVYQAGTFTPALAPTVAFARIDGTVHLTNHISSMEVTTTGGMKYVYGLPVYTINQSEVQFSSAQPNADAQGLTAYTSTENSILNGSGSMHLYDKTTVPSYASSFLLTGMHSSDYIDLLTDGYTVDDIGDYYKINYSRVYDKADPYKWRFPMGQNKALFSEGLLATDRDNTASYTYGEKEIWYTHSVESKNMIAEFTLSDDRIDAMSVMDENGQLSPTKGLKKLAKITLYNRNERLTKGINAKPLQIIEFIYDYSLCLNNPANKNYNPSGGAGQAGTGKLTLKEIRVYSGPQSEETALHPYTFIYSANNPDFHYKKTDRWGNYRPEDANKPLELYPYAEQNLGVANPNASAWKLFKIQSPSGSEMEVTYEADTYRYVQNKRAMKHIDVKGYTTPIELANILNNPTWDGSNRVGNQLHKKLTNSDVAGLVGLTTGQLSALSAFVYTQIVSNNIQPTDDIALFRQKDQLPANVVVFELEEPIIASNKAAADLAFRETYLKADESQPAGKGYLDEVYLRSFIQVKENGPYELIPTFATIKDNDLKFEVTTFGNFPTTGVMPPTASGGGFKYGYIILQNVVSTDDGIPIAMSPIQKTALEFARLHLTDIVYGSCVDCDGDVTIDKKAFWKGDIYKEMAKAHYAETIAETNPSQIRLFDHDNKKVGGNARVAKITMRDNWNTISGETGAEYYWIYEYDRTSYGVTAYEPASGNDENSFYSWDRFTNKSVSFPDETRFNVTPIGESLYPTPTVGYRSVTLRLSGNQVALTNQLGYSLSTFETAYEHPTVTLSTGIQKVKADKNSIFKIEIDLFGLSEGHSVITNDFHGKPKDYRIYNANGDLQGRTTYTYKKLGDQVKMMDQNGTVTNRTVSAEYDFSVDSRFVLSTFTTTSLGLSLSFPLTPPSFIPSGFTPILSSSYREVGFYAHVLNKHINYSAVVERVETESLGSVNTAQDLVYDIQNGSVLLTSLTDEYNEPLYSFSYPAHWYYSLFRNPLQQPTAVVAGTLASGTFTASSGLLTDKFTVGDLVSIQGSSSQNALVLSVSGNTVKLINAVSPFTSVALTGSANVTLLKSGRKNILSATMQSVVTKRNPLNGMIFTFPSQDIIDASAVTFRPRLNVQCRENVAIGNYESQVPAIVLNTNSVINPFSKGLLNNLVLEHSYIPQLERSSTQTQGIRYNGTYSGYYNFYARGTNGDWYQVDETGHPNVDLTNLRYWRPMGQLAVLDEYGRPLESSDQIDVSSAVLYGYNRLNKLIPVAQAVNAKQHEIAYDSFDDYGYMSSSWTAMVKGHFDFAEAITANPTNVLLSSINRHSGVSSLSVNNNVTATVKRAVTPANSCVNPVNSFSASQYTIEQCMCVKGFEPIAGKKYIISLWVKGNALNASNNYTDCSVSVTYPGSAIIETFFPTGQMIDGWQRIEGSFVIPPTVSEINVNLNNTSAVGGAKTYFDDIRLHPFVAGMTTMVYDPETLLPMAAHDGYNFTTFFGYDENLMQVRVKVETINGIQTISESEGSTIMKFKN